MECGCTTNGLAGDSGDRAMGVVREATLSPWGSSLLALEESSTLPGPCISTRETQGELSALIIVTGSP